MPESRKIFIVYNHPTGALDEWKVGVPVGWDDMSGQQRKRWAVRKLRRKDSSCTYKYFERER
jgi:hypothetical protein